MAVVEWPQGIPFVMQINRRDFIEFQLEESTGSTGGVGGTGGGGGGVSSSSGGGSGVVVGGIIGTADDKLDYRVTMAIEKNTQLVSFPEIPLYIRMNES